MVSFEAGTSFNFYPYADVKKLYRDEEYDGWYCNGVVEAGSKTYVYYAHQKYSMVEGVACLLIRKDLLKTFESDTKKLPGIEFQKGR